MIKSVAVFLAVLSVCAVASVSAVYLTPVELPSALGTIDGPAPEQTAGTCCTRCCVTVTVNPDSTYTWIESDCDSGRICRIATGVLRPKR